MFSGFEARRVYVFLGGLFAQEQALQSQRMTLGFSSFLRTLNPYSQNQPLVMPIRSRSRGANGIGEQRLGEAG